MARVKLSFAFIRAFDAHLYRAGSGSEAVRDRQEWPALARMPMQWRRPEPDVLRHSQGETGNQASERENRAPAVRGAKGSGKKSAAEAAVCAMRESTGHVERSRPSPGIAIRDQKR
ncbi:hypothetical protein ACV22X_19530 [Burkholderia orbicola]